MTRLIIRRAEYEGAVTLAMSRFGWPRERAVAAAELLYVPVAAADRSEIRRTKGRAS